MKKTHIILDKLHHNALSMAELLESFVPGYAETYKAMNRKIKRHTYPEKVTFEQWKRRQEKSFYALLSRLKKDGLVKKQKLGLGFIWRITQEGIEKLKSANDRNMADIPKKTYEISKDTDLTLVIFDIPEKFNKKRAWLRWQLKELGFIILQKSVWMGEYKIPEEFIYDLRNLKLLPYIHILKIQKKGSLMNLDL